MSRGDEGVNHLGESDGTKQSPKFNNNLVRKVCHLCFVQFCSIHSRCNNQLAPKQYINYFRRQLRRGRGNINRTSTSRDRTNIKDKVNKWVGDACFDCVWKRRKVCVSEELKVKYIICTSDVSLE